MRQELTVWAAAFFLSLAQWRHTAFFFGNCTTNCDMSDVIRAVEAENGILQGYPHWRFFQSRLLGPVTEKLVSLLFGVNLTVAHTIVAVIVLTAASVVMFYAGRAIGGRQSGWSAMLTLQLLFALTMSRPWLYIWDYFLLLLSAIFMLLVIRRARWWWFLALLGVAIFNHESALFIGVWMVAQALGDAWAERRDPDWGLLSAGVLGNIAGIIAIEYLRNKLLKQEIGWQLFKDSNQTPHSWLDAYFHVQISANFGDIYQWLTHPDFALMFFIPAPIILALILAGCLVARHGAKAVGLAVYVVAEVVGLLALGFIQETRVLLELVPFLCLGGMLAARAEWPAAWQSENTGGAGLFSPLVGRPAIASPANAGGLRPPGAAPRGEGTRQSR
jgi:hypothetical protein